MGSLADGIPVFFDHEDHVRICAAGLTSRQQEILQWLVDHENDADGDGELVQEGRAVWYGLETTSAGLVMKLMHMMAISCDGLGGLVERWRINETGKKILAVAKAGKP